MKKPPIFPWFSRRFFLDFGEKNMEKPWRKPSARRISAFAGAHVQLHGPRKVETDQRKGSECFENMKKHRKNKDYTNIVYIYIIEYLDYMIKKNKYKEM